MEKATTETSTAAATAGLVDVPLREKGSTEHLDENAAESGNRHGNGGDNDAHSSRTQTTEAESRRTSVDTSVVPPEKKGKGEGLKESERSGSINAEAAELLKGEKK